MTCLSMSLSKNQTNIVLSLCAADLTGTGHDQAVSLSTMLAGGGWFSKMSGGKPVRAIISPLTR